MKKVLFFILLLNITLLATIRTWNSSGSTDANDPNNYLPFGIPNITDTLILNNTSVVNWIQTDSLNVASINMATTYTGNWSMNGHPLVTAHNLYLDGTIGSWIMNSNYYMTDIGKFHIGSFGSFSGYGCNLFLNGSRDTIEFTKWGLTKSNYFRNLSCGINSTDKCWIVSNIGACIYHQWSIGLGEVVRTAGGYFGVDPDSSRPFNFSHSPHNATCPAFNGGVALYLNDSTINNIYWGFMFVGGSMNPAIVVNTNNDTLIFDDSITAPGVMRWVLGVGHSITVKNTTKYFNSFGGASIFGGDTSSSLVWHLGSANVYGLSQVNAFGTPKVTFYMDTSIFQITSNYNTSSTHFKSFTTYPMQSRTVIWNAITITTSGESYNVVACTTATNKSFLTQFKCKDFIVKEGTTSFATKPIITGNYIDSTGLNPLPETLSIISHITNIDTGGGFDTMYIKGAGANFGLYGKIKVNGILATINSWNRTTSTGDTVKICITVPPHSIGTVTDSIWGQYSATSTIQTTTVYFIDSLAKIYNINPTHGTGGNTITINGNNFGSLPTVKIFGNILSSYISRDKYHVSFIAPIHTSNSTYITVTNNINGTKDSISFVYDCISPTIQYESNISAYKGFSINPINPITTSLFDSIKAITTLPNGLIINKLTGTISGIPLDTSSIKSYTIRIYGCDSTSTTISIKVNKLYDTIKIDSTYIQQDTIFCNYIIINNSSTSTFSYPIIIFKDFKLNANSFQPTYNIGSYIKFVGGGNHYFYYYAINRRWPRIITDGNKNKIIWR